MTHRRPIELSGVHGIKGSLLRGVLLGVVFDKSERHDLVSSRTSPIGRDSIPIG